MNGKMRALRQTALVAGAVLICAAAASAEEIRVMTSGGFTAAYLELVPQFEQATHNTIVSAFGASMGDSPNSIPSRLRRGEPVDVVILAASALDDLIKAGKVVAGSRVDLVRSRIGMAVKAGAPKPDISSVDALKRTLLNAKSIAYSDSASGVYLSTVLFARLGIAEQMKNRSRKVQGNERVGTVVARGDAEIGFQQISELLPVPGITYVGPLPPGAQQVTIFSAGIAVGARAPQAAAALIAFFTSPQAAPVIKKSGLEPMVRPGRLIRPYGRGANTAFDGRFRYCRCFTASYMKMQENGAHTQTIAASSGKDAVFDDHAPTKYPIIPRG
jgi:molybdate transport system substrate-binding protein